MSSGAGPAGLEIDEVLDILSRSDDADLGEIVELVANICDSEAAGITIRRGGDYHVPITHGIEPFVCPASDTFCQFTMNTDGIFCIEDTHADPRFSGTNSAYGGLERPRFYASAPLYSPRGEMIGRLCVIDSRTKTLTPLQRR